MSGTILQVNVEHVVLFILRENNLSLAYFTYSQLSLTFSRMGSAGLNVAFFMGTMFPFTNWIVCCASQNSKTKFDCLAIANESNLINDYDLIND